MLHKRIKKGERGFFLKKKFARLPFVAHLQDVGDLICMNPPEKGQRDTKRFKICCTTNVLSLKAL